MKKEKEIPNANQKQRARLMLMKSNTHTKKNCRKIYRKNEEQGMRYEV